MTAVTTLEDLFANALKDLHIFGWMQGDYGMSDGPKCVLGILRMSAFGSTSVDPDADGHIYEEGKRAFLRAIGYDENDFCPFEFLWHITAWNDDDGRTIQEVEAAFKAALEQVKAA